MRVRLLLIPLILSLAACSGDTGILIKTSTSEGFDQSIAALRFYVGKDTIDDPLYFADSSPIEDIQLNGRDIAAAPYKLLLQPKTEDMGSLVVAAIALDEQGNLIGFGRLEAPIEFVPGSVLEWPLTISAAGSDIFVTDTGCLKWQVEGGDYVHIGAGDDKDCDGVAEGDGPGEDCNDLSPFQSPNVGEDCYNEIDDNCNGFIDAEDYVDSDGDGFSACGDSGLFDCNDNNNAIYPGAKELCDGLDNDCNNRCDDGYDEDGDGVSAPCGSVIERDGETSWCVGMGEVDCNPGSGEVFPGNVEICDGIDNDCNQICDDDTALDPDGDGFTDCGSRVSQCGQYSAWEDCEPDDERIYPGAHDLCDGIDNNCDGTTDPSTTPCFMLGSNAGDTCQEGFRYCSAGAPNSLCTIDDPTNKTALDDNWCTNYDTCDDDPLNPDPFMCSLEVAATLGTPEVCTVHLLGGTEMCPGSQAVQVFPPGGPFMGTGCSYTLIGGNDQQGYGMKLIDSVKVIDGAKLTNCTAGLLVGTRGSQWPGDAAIPILFIDDGGVAHEIRLELKGKAVESCNTLEGLECATWPNLAVALP